MSRIDRRFAELASGGRTGLIPFFTAGDPSPDSVVPIMLQHHKRDGGAFGERGFPFAERRRSIASPMVDEDAIHA